MKKQILLIVTTLFTTLTFSQVAFQVISNPCDSTLEQSYQLIYVDTLSGWNCPDITNPSNAIQGELAFVNDGSTPGIFANIGTPPISIETTTDACEDALWTQDLTGKIAVIWRGTCEYSCKAKRAQSKGAIGIIIINHTGEATGMASGTCGLNVTIPVIMIGREDGELLLNCIDTGGMIGFIGNSNGAFANDVGSSIADIIITQSSSIPWKLAQNGTEYPVDFGIWVYNKGINPQNGVTASVEVNFNGSMVYSQTSTPVNFTAPDTTYRDSNYFDLGTYAPTLWNIGKYTVTYTINNIGDQFLFDNSFSFDFKITNDVYAKCRTDSLGSPIHSYYGLTYIVYCNEQEWESCIEFKNEFAGARNTIANGLIFSSKSVTNSIENLSTEINVYQWSDAFTNLDSTITFNNLSLLDNVIYTYPDDSLEDVNLFLPFNNPIALQDNQHYLFCVKNSIYELAVGTDYGIIDYKTTIEHYLQPPFYFQIIDNLCGNFWFIDGYSGLVPAISLNIDIATNVNETTTEVTSYPYPNPANNLLTIPIKRSVSGNIKLEMFDVLGKIVLTENKNSGNNQSLKVNVASITNGNYLFKLTFDDGTSDVFKVSVNR